MRSGFRARTLVAIACACLAVGLLAGCVPMGPIGADDPWRISLRVEHDHGDYWAHPCVGVVYVRTSGMVGYSSRERPGHSWEVPPRAIDEARLNDVIGSERGAFHIRLDNGENFNFAPLEGDSADDLLYEIDRARREGRRHRHRD